MSAGPRELLLRCNEFTLGFDRECADRVEPVEGGLAVLTPSLPLVWALNYVIFERPGMEAERMAEVCDAALAAEGYGHREIHVRDPDQGERVAPAFLEMGWEVERNVFMLHNAGPDRPAPAQVAVRCEPHPVALRRALLTQDEFLAEESTSRQALEALAEQLIELERRQSRLGGDRWYVADADGEPAAATRLLARDGIGQIEDVATLASARNRGLARATVLAAVGASRADGNEPTFVIADADDWPLKLYERLGFRSIGTFPTFRAPREPTP